MQKRTSESSVVNSSNDSKKTKMENFHQRMLVSGTSNENTANTNKSFFNFCKENTLKLTDDKCLQSMSEVAEQG